MPGLGGLIMLLLFLFYAAFVVYADPGYGMTSVDLPLIGRTGGVTVLGLGALLLGLLLMPLVTRGHAVALKLQRSLLLGRLPLHAAVDGGEPLPARDSGSGVGGDWGTDLAIPRRAPGSAWSSGTCSVTACAPRPPWAACARGVRPGPAGPEPGLSPLPPGRPGRADRARARGRPGSGHRGRRPTRPWA